jgi:hypothetical protein
VGWKDQDIREPYLPEGKVVRFPRHSFFARTQTDTPGAQGGHLEDSQAKAPENAQKSWFPDGHPTAKFHPSNGHQTDIAEKQNP